MWIYESSLCQCVEVVPTSHERVEVVSFLVYVSWVCQCVINVLVCRECVEWDVCSILLLVVLLICGTYVPRFFYCLGFWVWYIRSTFLSLMVVGWWDKRSTVLFLMVVG